MVREPIFQALPQSLLLDIANYLSFDSIIAQEPITLLRSLPQSQQVDWLHAHRNDLEDEFCSVGSWTFGSTKSYGEIVRGLAGKVGVTYSDTSDTAAIEVAIITKLWNNAVKKMAPEQLQELKAQAEAFAKQHRKSVGKEFAGFASLAAAQMSGFGVYLLGSTLLGAINSALGLGLGFGAFTGLSSLISTVIGPFGWAALGVMTIVKLGAPNYKKVLPTVILIGAYRPLIEAESTSVEDSGVKPRAGAPHASAPPRPETVVTSAEIKRFEQDVTDFSRASKARRRVPPLEGRRITKRERAVFALQNPELCRIATELDVDYLDLSPDGQETVRQLLSERKEFEAKQADEARREARRQRKQAEQQSGRKSDQKNEQLIETKRKEYKHLLRNLEFTDIALERLCVLSKDESVPVWSELGLLNDGMLDDKHHVPGTRPKIFQRDAGRGGRIYFRRKEGPKAAHIELIGTKKSEDADYRRLQNRK
jgi:uncharacterized protein YaaW (UPF0174 family)